MDLRDVVAVVFYLARGRIEGLARLQLMMYILHRKTRLVNAYFETWWTVPWSEEVERTVGELVRDGLLSVSRDGHAHAQIYTASEQLIRRGAEVCRKIEERDPYTARVVKLVVAYGASLPLGRLALAARMMCPDTVRCGIQRLGPFCNARKA